MLNFKAVNFPIPLLCRSFHYSNSRFASWSICCFQRLISSPLQLICYFNSFSPHFPNHTQPTLFQARALLPGAVLDYNAFLASYPNVPQTNLSRGDLYFCDCLASEAGACLTKCSWTWRSQELSSLVSTRCCCNFDWRTWASISRMLLEVALTKHANGRHRKWKKMI